MNGLGVLLSLIGLVVGGVMLLVGWILNKDES
jgi:hypothetical protein